MKEEISTKVFLAELKREVKALGGPTKAAKHWGVWPQNVSSALSGASLPVKAILKGMKLKPLKEIKYRYERLS